VVLRFPNKMKSASEEGMQSCEGQGKEQLDMESIFYTIEGNTY